MITISQDPVGRVACVYGPAVTPELVQTFPSTTQRALGTQLIFLLDFACPEDKMMSNCVDLECEIQ